MTFKNGFSFPHSGKRKCEKSYPGNGIRTTLNGATNKRRFILSRHNGPAWKGMARLWNHNAHLVNAILTVGILPHPSSSAERFWPSACERKKGELLEGLVRLIATVYCKLVLHLGGQHDNLSMTRKDEAIGMSDLPGPAVKTASATVRNDCNVTAFFPAFLRPCFPGWRVHYSHFS